VCHASVLAHGSRRDRGQAGRRCGKDMAPAKLTIRNVRHFYPAPGGSEELCVLDDVSFDVAAGEFISIIGASGSGKTTLLRIVDRLVAPRQGTVLIDGAEVERPGGKIAFVFQHDSLWPWRTVMENAIYGLEIHGVRRAECEAQAQRFLDLVGLGGFERYYPHQLSGGMRQRVNLARALTVDPDILLMDEPFAALDAQTREIMQLEVTRIWHETKKTVLFVTHQIDEAVFLSDRVITLSARPGKVRADTRIELLRPRDIRIKRTEGIPALCRPALGHDRKRGHARFRSAAGRALRTTDEACRANRSTTSNGRIT
jgi:NitT/TauT family transport system ATP-binding protein